MEATWLYTTLSLLLFFILFRLSQAKNWRRRNLNLPPSPERALPVIGHLHLFKQPLHRTLHSLSKKYGPILSLRLGSRLLVVVSSPSAVEECFTKNDVVLANRPHFIIGKHVAYNYTTMIGSNYGDHWRNLRRLSANEVFSTSRLNAFRTVRREEIRILLTKLNKSSPQGGFAKVELKSKLKDLLFNIVMRMVAGKRYFGEDVDGHEDAREVIAEVFKSGGASNPGDFLPILRLINFKGIEKKLANLGKRMDVFLQGLLDEHRRNGTKDTMIGHLLSLQESQPDYYTDQTIKGLILNMVTAGTDTSAVTIEWAMSLLLNHPEVLKKARTELDNYVGLDRMIDEPDLSKLPYLQKIISETLRLFPAVPLLVPHESAADCTIGGYDVPQGTVVMVNAWTIHRDPKVWDDAETFKPERFEGGEAVETHKLIPFGMGKRACPGAGMANRVVGLCLASLIQCFEWERVSEKEIDLSEGIGVSMPKAEPLEAMCKGRVILDKILSQGAEQV